MAVKRQVRVQSSPRAEVAERTPEAPKSVPVEESLLLPDITQYRTLDRALELLKTKDSEPLSKTMKSRELGLGLALAGVTELQAHRLARLHKALVLVEDRILQPEIIRNMDTVSLVAFYKLVSSNVEAAGKFVYEISKVLNWDKLREALLDFEAEDATSTREEAADMQNTAAALLKHVITMKNKA